MSLIMIFLFNVKYRFLEVYEFKFNNVNKGGWKANKHIELWAKNFFWWLVTNSGYDVQKFIDSLSESGDYQGPH
jgi:hypothetical protein